VIDSSNLDWMGDENECVLLMSCTIQTEQYSSPEDDNMGTSARQTLMEKLDQVEGLDLEVSGTMSNTDYAPPTEEDARLLEKNRNSKAGREKGSTIQWSAFVESHISEIRKRGYSVCCFHGFILVGMAISTKAEKLILESRIGLDNSCSWLMVGLRRERRGASMS
jgi:hypothetical protein